MAIREISPIEPASTTVTATLAADASAGSDTQAAALQVRSQRHALFREHMDRCPACSQEHNEMCAIGYRLLKACLE